MPGYDCDGRPLFDPPNCANAQMHVHALRPAGSGMSDRALPYAGFAVTVTGNPETGVHLYAYTRPGTTTYYLGLIRLGADGKGIYRNEEGDAAIRRTGNTRLWIINASPDCPQGYDTDVVIVETAFGPIKAVRNAPRHYTFTGHAAGVPGKAINLYRTPSGGGTLTLVAQTRLRPNGTWVIDRAFLGSGEFDLLVRAGDDINSGGGQSRMRFTVIH